MPCLVTEAEAIVLTSDKIFLTSDKIFLTPDKKTAKGCWAVVLSSLSVMRLMGIDYLKRQVMVPSPLVVRLVGTAKRLLSDSRSQ